MKTQGYLFHLLFTGCITLIFSLNSLTGQPLKDFKTGEIKFSTHNLFDEEYRYIKDYDEKFNLLDDIFARVFLEKPLGAHYDDFGWVYDFEDVEYTYNYAVQFTVDGKTEMKWAYELSPPERFNTLEIIEFVISPGPDQKYTFSRAANEWEDLVMRMDEGERHIDVEVIATNRDVEVGQIHVIAKGDFIYHKDNDDMKEFIEKKTLQPPEPTLVKPDVEKQMMRASKDLFQNVTVLDAIIVDRNKDWNYSYDQFGNIKGRQIAASIVYQDNLRDHRCFVRTFLFYQDHHGKGDYDEVRHSGNAEGYYQYELNCDKLE